MDRSLRAAKQFVICIRIRVFVLTVGQTWQIVLVLGRQFSRLQAIVWLTPERIRALQVSGQAAGCQIGRRDHESGGEKKGAFHQ
tara:strand:- start:3458 stop:3709 length:252 start_codon:yes stop_codon:yes gene_type:complete